MTRTALVSTFLSALALGISAGIAGMAVADPLLMAKAKQGGFPAQNCQYCHVPALPTKDTFKPEDLNERGKWLVEEKGKRNAKEVSVDWLKEYKGK
jgi:hypothetical protein